MNTETLFVKYGCHVRGPLSYSQVAAHIAAGGLKLSDRGSFDRKSWHPLGELIAPEAVVLAELALAESVRPATRGRRIGAFFLDVVLTALGVVFLSAFVTLGLHVAVFGADVITQGVSPEDAQRSGALFPFGLVISILLFISLQLYLLMKRGGTMGKLLTGLRVAAVAEDGEILGRPGFWVSLKRIILAQSMILCPPFGLVFCVPNFFFFLWRGSRPLHDRWAGTRVIDRNEMPESLT